MADLDNEGLKTGKKTLARWFIGKERRFFLPPAGPGLHVTDAEERAIRAAAEPVIRRRFELMRGWLSILVLLMVAVPSLFYWRDLRLFGEVVHSGVVSLGSFTLGALLMLFVTWRYETEMMDLREAIALSLRERDDVAATSRGSDAREPNIRKLGNWAFAVTAALMLWPLASAVARRLGMSGGPAWAWEVLAGTLAGLVIGVLAFAALWSLRLRPAAATPEDGPG